MSDKEEGNATETTGKVKLPAYLQDVEKNIPTSRPAWMQRLSTAKSGRKGGQDPVLQGDEQAQATSALQSNIATTVAPSKSIWMPKMGLSSTPEPKQEQVNGAGTSLPEMGSSGQEPDKANEQLNLGGASGHSVTYGKDDNDEPGSHTPKTPESLASRRSSQGKLLSDFKRLRNLAAAKAGRAVETNELLQSLHASLHASGALKTSTDHKDSHKRIMGLSTSDDETHLYEEKTGDDDDDDDDDDDVGEFMEEVVSDDDGDNGKDGVDDGATGEESLSLNSIQPPSFSIVPKVPVIDPPPSPGGSSFAPPPPSKDRTKKLDPIETQEPVPSFKPTSPTSFAPPTSKITAADRSKENQEKRPRLPAAPSNTNVVSRELPAPPSLRDLNQLVEDDDNWLFPRRQEDDSSWVDPYHPVPRDRKLYLSQELKKKSVDLFPDEGESTSHLQKLKAIHEEARSLDLEYDAKVGLMVGRGHYGDGPTVSETSMSDASKMDATAKVLESAVPDKRMDVWAVPSQDGSTYRAAGKLKEHKDGKDYRFSYIAQQHTHSAASYADIVRERYFPKEDNEYWAAPARTAVPELPIHIAKDGTVKNGPPDANEDWMPPENSQVEPAVEDKTKYYAPTIAEEKYAESRSVVTEGSDWMGLAPAGRSARVDFTGKIKQSDDSDNSFVWNPVTHPSEEGGSVAKNVFKPRPFKSTKTVASPVKVEPKVQLSRVGNLPRPPSPQGTPGGVRPTKPPPHERVINKGALEYSPSGRLSFNMNHETILIGNEDRRGNKGVSQERRIIEMLLCCCFLVLVPLAVALIIIFVVNPDDRRGEFPKVPTVPSPSMAPVVAPTLPPVLPPAAKPTVTEGALIDFLSSISADDGVALRDPNSPQYAAMKWLQTSANQGIYDEQVVIQRYALATLYYSTNGGQWGSSTGWLSSEPECEWQTLSVSPSVCDDDGQLVALNLNANNLAGSIPPELNLMSASLISLELGNNKLTGQIPASLSDLRGLQVLQLSQNQLRGTIPTVLGLLSNLQTMLLYLNSMQSTIPTEFGRLTRLTEIDLGANLLTGPIPTEFGQMRSLETISLYVNQLTGTIPSQLASIPNLRVLYLDTNAFRGFLPEEICRDLTFDEFWTDCSDIGGCECCTKCCDEGESCS